MFDWVLNSSVTCNIRQKFINERLCFFCFRLYRSLTCLIFLFNDLLYRWCKTKQCQMTTISQRQAYHLLGRAEISSKANKDPVQLSVKTTELFCVFFFFIYFSLKGNKQVSRFSHLFTWTVCTTKTSKQLFFTINLHFVTSNQISTYRKLNLPLSSSIYFVSLPLEMQKRLQQTKVCHKFSYFV